MSNTYNIKFDVNSLPMGIDTADVNGPVNVTKDLAFGIDRAGEGLYRDTQYGKTRAQYDKFGVPFIAYHVLYPGQDVAKTIANFKSWAGSGCYGYCWDLEVTNGQSKSKISQDTRDVTLALLDAGLNVINYSTSSWINTYFRNANGVLPDWVTACKWYLAQYNLIGERNNLDIPTGIKQENVLIFQTWNKAPNIYGSKYDSVYVDRDRWIGVFPGKTQPVVTPAPAQNMITIVAQSGVVIRTGAGQIFPKISALPCGVQREILDTASDAYGNPWARVNEGWICEKFGSQVLAEVK